MRERVGGSRWEYRIVKLRRRTSLKFAGFALIRKIVFKGDGDNKEMQIPSTLWLMCSSGVRGERSFKQIQVFLLVNLENIPREYERERERAGEGKGESEESNKVHPQSRSAALLFRRRRRPPFGAV